MLIHPKFRPPGNDTINGFRSSLGSNQEQPLCRRVYIEASFPCPTNQYAQFEIVSHDCVPGVSLQNRRPANVSSLLFFFTLLFKSRPNSPPRVNLFADSRVQSLLGIFLFVFFRVSRLKHREVAPGEASEGLTHATCVRSVTLILYHPTRYAPLQRSGYFPVNPSPSFSVLHWSSINTTRLRQHVQALFPLEGSREQVGQACQEDLS